MASHRKRRTRRTLTEQQVVTLALAELRRTEDALRAQLHEDLRPVNILKGGGREFRDAFRTLIGR